jgi:hypothetical protein
VTGIGLYDDDPTSLPDVPTECNVEAEYTFEICNRMDGPIVLDPDDTELIVNGTEITTDPGLVPPLFVGSIEPEVCSKHYYTKTVNLCEPQPLGSGLVRKSFDMSMTVSGEELCVDEVSKGGKGKGKGGKSCKGKGKGKGKGGKGKGGKGKGSDSKGGKGKGGKSSKSKGSDSKGGKGKGGKSSKSKGNSKGGKGKGGKSSKSKGSDSFESKSP